MKGGSRCDDCGKTIEGDGILGLCPQCVAMSFLAPDDVVETGFDGKGISFGDYDLVREIARGGMGVVYEAWQRSLERRVAVKTVTQGVLAGSEAMSRFRAEAKAVAKMRHPNIVAVHEVSEHEGQPFFSMDFVDGGHLGERVAQHPLPPREAAECVSKVAGAVHSAHSRGIIHRDLKPANILLDSVSGEPFVTDFGLAKRLDADLGLTRVGSTLGTPSYLSPEQAGDSGAQVGPAADIYALGAILYHVLTGRPPFLGETLQATLAQVMGGTVVEPRRLNASVSKDLETICLKCLRKDPSRRYRTAEALADDLVCYLEGRPILARPVGKIERVSSWCRRNPAFAGMTVLAAAILLAGVAGVLWQWRRAENLAKNEFVLRSDAEQSLRQLHFNRADELLEADDVPNGLAHLGYLIRKNPGDRPAATRLVSELSYRRFARQLQDPDPLPEGGKLEPMFVPGEASVVSVVCGNAQLEMRRHPGGESLGRVALPDWARVGEISLNGKRAIFGCRNGSVVVVNAGENEIYRRWDLGADEELSVAHISDSGGVAMARTKSGKVILWDVEQDRETARYHLGETLNIAMLAGNGEWVATTFATKVSPSVRLWKTQSPEPLGRPMQCAGEPRYISRSLNDDVLMVSSHHGTLEAWATPSCDPIGSAKTRGDVVKMLCGRYNLVTVSWNEEEGEAWIQPGLGSRLAFVPILQPSEVSGGALSWDASRMAALAQGRGVFFHATLTDDFPIAPIWPRTSPTAVVFSKDNHGVAVQSDSEMSVYTIDRAPALSRKLLSDVNGVYPVTDTDVVLTRGPKKWLARWNAGTNPDGFDPLPLRGVFSTVAFNRSGNIIVLSQAGKIWAFRLGQGKDDSVSATQLYQLGTKKRFYGVAVGPRDRYLVYGVRGGLVRRADLATGEDRPFHGEGVSHDGSSAHEIVFDSFGKRIAVAWRDQVRVFDAETGKSISPPLPQRVLPDALLFSPDGEYLVVNSPRDGLLVYRLSEGFEVRRVLAGDSLAYEAAISHDSKRLVAGTMDGKAAVWDLASLRRIGDAMTHGSAVRAVTFSEDDSIVATGTVSGDVRVWDVLTGEPMTGRLKQQGAVVALRFHGDSAQLLAISDEVRNWWVPVPDVSTPSWLPDLAEAIGGRRVSGSGYLESASTTFVGVRTKIRARIATGEDGGFWSEWARYFLQDGMDRAIHPASDMSLRDYREALLRQGTPDDLEEARRLDPRAPDVLRALVDRALTNQRENGTREWLETAHYAGILHESDPDGAAPAIGLGAALVRLGQESTAGRILDSVDSTELKDCVLLLCKARILASLDRYTEAKATYTDAFRSGMTNPGLDGFCRDALLERRALGRRSGREHEAVGDFLRDRGIEARSDDTPGNCIDLSSHYTAGLDEDWHGRQWEGQNLAELPRHTNVLNGVPFDLRGVVQLRGRSLEASAPGYPESVRDIRVDRRSGAVHFLHALGWGTFAHAETHVAHYVIHYTDGTQENVELVNGENIFEWGINSQSLPRFKRGVSLVWQDKNKRGNKIGLYQFTWTNPRPDVPITSIDFVSTGTNAAPFLVAVTVEE